MRKRTFAIILGILPALFFSCDNNTENQSHAQEAQVAHDEHKQQLKTVEGVASGFDCAVVNVLCPSTHRAADYTTGLFTDDAQFYFVANIPQSFMTQYFLDRLEITGTIYKPYHHAIEPEEIHLVEGNEKTLVYQEGYFIDPNGHRALFNEGRTVDGVWYCDQCVGAR